MYFSFSGVCEDELIFFNYIRAAAYTQINKYTEAIEDCHKSIEIDPYYSKAYSRLGLAYYAQGKYRDAIDEGFQKGLKYYINLFCCILLDFLNDCEARTLTRTTTQHKHR